MHFINMLLVVILCVLINSCAENTTPLFRTVSFKTADGGKIYANRFEGNDHAVILAHGKIFNKESWETFASRLSDCGFTVLAIDFRGYGQSEPGTKESGLEEDILGAIRFLRNEEIKKVSILGGSMGGCAAGRAAVQSAPGMIHKLILLSPTPFDRPEEIHAGDILFIASKEEGNRAQVEALYSHAPEPKKIELLEGNAHAQHLFKTDEAKNLESLIVAFLER